MVKIDYRFPQDVDIVALAETMRRADIEELEAVTELPPCEAVVRSVQASDPKFLKAWYCDAGLICISGCSPVSHTRAVPWLLGTDLLDLHCRRLHDLARVGVLEMLADYEVLSNVVDVRQVKVIRWLERLGFAMLYKAEARVGFEVWHFERSR